VSVEEGAEDCADTGAADNILKMAEVVGDFPSDISSEALLSKEQLQDAKNQAG